METKNIHWYSISRVIIILPSILLIVLYNMVFSVDDVPLNDHPDYKKRALNDQNSINLNSGDPGWIRKMAMRKMVRRDAAGDKTALAALKVDRFKLPVLLGSFSDQSGTITASNIKEHLFSDSSGQSMTDYFNEVSYGQFEITGDVFGWYKTDSTSKKYLPSKYRNFCYDIIDKADSTVNFGLYDNDGPDGIPNSADDDGYVDAVMIIFPGVGLEYGNLNNFNSSQLEISPGYTTNDRSQLGDFIKIRCFVLVSELGEFDGSVDIFSLGVACHEMGHVLGLPDLYDYTGNTYGLGNWCLMSGALGHMSAWCKVMLGWVSPVIIEDAGSVALHPVELEPDILMLWEDGYGLSRYFLLEYRSKGTGFDKEIPGSGLMIYHVDENNWWGIAKSKYNNQQINSMLVDIEEADGRNDLDLHINPGDNGDPFPGASGNDRFNNLSNPASSDSRGNLTGISVSNIDHLWSVPVITADVLPRTPLGYSIAYDHMGIVNGLNSTEYWGGVLFTAEKAGYLTGVDFGCPYGDNGFEVIIFKSVNKTLPEGWLYSVSGNAPFAGYHTIEIEDKWIRVEENQQFFVTLKLAKGIWTDNITEETGYSYVSLNGLGFERVQANINIRARIRTVNPVLCDFNADGAVDNGDVISLLIHLRNNPGNLEADFNRDNRANILDAFSMLIAQRSGRCEDPVDQ